LPSFVQEDGGDTRRTRTTWFPRYDCDGSIRPWQQCGIAGEVTPLVLTEGNSGATGGMKYIPKRLLSIMVQDADVDLVVKVIIRVNQTAQIGDGKKIFVCPLDDALRVRKPARRAKARSSNEDTEVIAVIWRAAG